MPRYKDITGMRFGKLLAIEWVDNLTQARNKRPRKRGYKRGKYKKCNHAIKGEE